jgi:hypothetical protein
MSAHCISGYMRTADDTLTGPNKEQHLPETRQTCGFMQRRAVCTLPQYAQTSQTNRAHAACHYRGVKTYVILLP